MAVRVCSMIVRSGRSIAAWSAYLGALAAVVASAAGPAQSAPALPEIRLSPANTVPACVTPERLMAFLKRRNGHLDPRFRDIAKYYKLHGEAWGVRWDYAFFQMAVETNFLTYRAPSGRMGDVDPKQNNFAGIGTTGGGVPGDSFPDVSTGVLGQIQHLVVYSGEMIPNPVAPRTQLKQEHILTKSRSLNRPVRFSDLARRWAADPKYGGSIEWVAGRFRAEGCKGRNPPSQETEQEVLPWQDKAPRRDDAHAAEPAPKKAMALADANPAVRTIWRRDTAQGKTAKAERAPAKPAPKTAPETANVPDVPVEPVAPVPPSISAEAVAPPAPTEDSDAHFALFTPPAALAGVVVPSRSADAPKPNVHPAETRKPADSAAARPPDLPVVPPRTGELQGPPEPPAAVAGASVGGFMVAGPSKSDFVPPSGLGVKPGRCVVEAARYGGETTVLVKAPQGEDVHYIALSVLDGFEDTMTQNFIASRPDGGEVVGTYPSRDDALAKARALCPD